MYLNQRLSLKIYLPRKRIRTFRKFYVIVHHVNQKTSPNILAFSAGTCNSRILGELGKITKICNINILSKILKKQALVQCNMRMQVRVIAEF